METVHQTIQTTKAHRDTILIKGKGLFLDKTERDIVYHWMKTDGYKVKRSIVKAQNLHPEYINDYVGTYDTGFGNTDYMRFWNVLYKVELVKV